MENILTLIAPTGTGDLTENRLADAAAGLASSGADVGPAAWLQPGEAADLPFAGLGLIAAAKAARGALAGAAIDVAAQPATESADGRRKRLLVADMDSTIIGQECLDEVADMAELGADVAELTRRAMAGEIKFAVALQERVALFQGLPLDLLQRTYDERIRLAPGALVLVRTMAAAGAVTALVSGGFEFFTSRVAAAAGFDTFGGNKFEIEDGVLTGRIDGPIQGADAKRAALADLMAEHEIARAETLAVGDGANDIPMLVAAGLGAAVRPKDVVRASADLTIEFGDLSALLYIQGYTGDEFVHD